MRLKPLATYYTTYSAATTAVYERVELMGYTIDEDDWFRKVNLGGKPKPGESKDSSCITLYKDGKEQRKTLHIQVYRIEMPDNFAYDRFELNWYIS